MRQEAAIESILDLNSTNVWKLTEQDIKKAWDAEKEEGSFATCEDKLLNIIRLSFDVVHYNPADPREKAKYENGEWATFQHCNEKRGWVAVRKKYITRLTDLSYENIHHITVSTLLELIANNFGGGWDSIALSMKDIILSGFDISTTTLPASRIHAPGGTLERKVAQGFEVLEITKGTWVEAIFAKKKEPVVSPYLYSFPAEAPYCGMPFLPFLFCAVQHHHLLLFGLSDNLALSGNEQKQHSFLIGSSLHLHNLNCFSFQNLLITESIPAMSQYYLLRTELGQINGIRQLYKKVPKNQLFSLSCVKAQPGNVNWADCPYLIQIKISDSAY